MNTTTFGQLATSLQLLTTGPNPPTVSADILGRDRHDSITIAELGNHLLGCSTAPSTRDAAWAHLVHQARIHGGQWVVIAAGLALPGLRNVAKTVRHIWPHTDPDDAESEVLSGFLDALKTIDLDEPRICLRLCRKAFSAGRTWARGQIHTALAVQRMYESHTQPRAYGHPELVLAQSVRENIITAIDAQLIASTRLDEEKLAKTASEIGWSVSEVRIRRKRSECALAEWITG